MKAAAIGALSFAFLGVLGAPGMAQAEPSQGELLAHRKERLERDWAGLEAARRIVVESEAEPGHRDAEELERIDPWLTYTEATARVVTSTKEWIQAQGGSPPAEAERIAGEARWLQSFGFQLRKVLEHSKGESVEDLRRRLVFLARARLRRGQRMQAHALKLLEAEAPLDPP